MGGNLPSGTRKIQKRTEKNMTDHYSDTELIEKVKEKIASADKVLIGLGEEWKRGINDDRELLSAYDSLYELIKDKDYFIVTMAVDGMIFDTALGSRMDRAVSSEPEPEETFSCPSADSETMALMDRLFPPKEQKRPEQDTRFQRIVAPCGNENWRQCSEGCTKDIWELGEIPDDICPHCGAPLTGNTIQATPYIEEGYLPQWEKYTQWLTKTLNRELVILELGCGFENPGVIRFPFEKTCFFNQKSFFCRVHKTFPQTSAELRERAVGVKAFSPEWIRKFVVK